MAREIRRDIRESRLDSVVGVQEQQTSIPRIVILSLVLMYLFARIIISSEYLGERATIDADAQPSITGMFGVFLLVLLTFLSGKFRVKWLKFSKSDMVIVYAMLSISALLFSSGFIQTMPASILGTAAGALGLARMGQESAFVPIFEKLSPLVSPKDDFAVFAAWLGGGIVDMHGVPWGQWLLPMMTWGIYYFVVFWVVLCFGTLLRKRWAEHQQLTYPLTEPILHSMDLMDTSAKDKEVRFSRILMYAGIAVSVIMTITEIIHKYYPIVPSLQPPSVMYDVVDVYFYVPPHVLGLAFLIPPTDLLFSTWFFAIVAYWAQTLVNYLGLSFQQISYAFVNRGIGMGALFAISFYALYTARHEVKQVFYYAIVRRESGEFLDEDEPMSYKVAVFTGLFGLVVLIAFHMFLLNMTLPISLYYILGIVLGLFAFLQVRASTGVPTSHALTGVWYEQTLYVFGKPAQSVHGWANFGPTMPMSYMTFGGVPANAMDCYEMAGNVGLKRRTLTWVLSIAFIAAIIMSFSIALPIVYEKGIYYLEERTWDTSPYWSNWWMVSASSSDIMKPQSGEIICTLVGLVFTAILFILRQVFYWFPLHPIGFTIAQTRWMRLNWGAFFVAWLIKLPILRYAGLRGYRRARPFFFGLVIGHVLAATVRAILAL